MTRTVDELRNDIRVAVGRYERVESTAFTKEALAAIAGAVGRGVEGTGRLPPKSRMRAEILRGVGAREEGTGGVERPFRKAELEAIAAALGA
ncbi:MAG: hypothetical protein ABEH77_06830 [Halobacteriaceae archaeon]